MESKDSERTSMKGESKNCHGTSINVGRFKVIKGTKKIQNPGKRGGIHMESGSWGTGVGNAGKVQKGKGEKKPFSSGQEGELGGSR